VYPIDSVLAPLPAVVVNDDARQSIRQGRPLVLDNDDVSDVSEGRSYPEQSMPVGASPDNRCRAYALDGRFLGVLRFNPETGQWQPEKVFL
ncbi:MAG: hypothetical protein HY663_04555, partial [Chloroflexi bacterium]|nr:hypothetical protein [Chloroflexota bacterium]